MEKADCPLSSGTSAINTAIDADVETFPHPKKIFLRLFVAVFSTRSQATIVALRKLCEEHLNGNYCLEVIDIYQQPNLARQFQILATPTLMKYGPLPIRMLVGDLFGMERILKCLGVII